METTKQRPRPIPDNQAHATPYLIVRDGKKALDFYQRAFHAVEVMRFEQPDGRIGHAEFLIGKAQVYLADEHPSMGYVGPATLGGTSVSIFLYVQDVDAFFAHALSLGAKQQMAVADQFYGDRLGVLEDPFGHRWSIASHIEDVSPEEMQRRASQHEPG